ncbi:hypothetical protein CALCODRAFT_506402 [Calocera cornea HHB12733]|uniref:Uncharacterized protein n=1 Tax=Calocera cornea HHB12733 TaxID=1353952 RepID=A0A165J008_9BASI|nr:hypothetical protein CALCODRAFT_506402 [Calocera cornea HHB12733]
MPSSDRQQRITTLQPPPAPRRTRIHRVGQHAEVSQAWSTQNNASSSPSPDSAPSPLSLSSVQHRGGLFTVDEAEERALDRYLAGHLPSEQLPTPHLPTPETPCPHSGEFGRSFAFPPPAPEHTFRTFAFPYARAVLSSHPEYFSPSLGAFAMDTSPPLQLPSPNDSLFQNFTPPPLVGLGIGLPAASSATQPPSPSSPTDEPTYYGSDITRIRDDTTYNAVDNSSDSAGALSSGEMLIKEDDALPLPATHGLPRDLMSMAMNMTMDMDMNFGNSANTSTHGAHTSLHVNVSSSSSTPEVPGPESSSSIAPPVTAIPHTHRALDETPLAASTPLHHFERSRAPPPSLVRRDHVVDSRPPAVSSTAAPPKEDDGLRGISAPSTPSNFNDPSLRRSASSPSPPFANANGDSGWHNDHDLDPDHDHDLHSDADHPNGQENDEIALSGEDDDPDDPAVNLEHYQSQLREWSFTTIDDWKDKLMAVVLGALPTSLEFESIQKERMQKKRGFVRTKLTNRQAAALDKGKRMFQEITRLFLDMLNVPSSVGAQRLGRWSPYLSNESPWNMWQRKWAAEHEEDDFDEEQCRQAYHVFVREHPDYRDTLASWERSHPRADGQKLTEAQRLRRWTHFTREMQDRATTWEQTHGFSSVVLACTLVPEDKFDQFTFFHETPQMTDFSIQRLGQTSYNARLLAFHWLGDRQVRRLTSHPDTGGGALITAPRRRAPLPTVAQMRKIYAEAVIQLEKQCAQLNPSANIQASARARWRDWDSFLIEAGCTMRNWPNILPWPWELTENRGSATQALLTPLYYAATGFNKQPKLEVTLWDDEDDPMLMRSSYSSSSSSGSDEDDVEDQAHDHAHGARKRPRTSGESDPHQPQPPPAEAVALPSANPLVDIPPTTSPLTTVTAAPPPHPPTQRVPGGSSTQPPPGTSPPAVGVVPDGPPPTASVPSWARPGEPWPRTAVAGPHRFHGATQEMPPPPVPAYDFEPPQDPRFVGRPDAPHYAYAHGRGRGERNRGWLHDAEWPRQPPTGYPPAHISRFRGDRSPYPDGFDAGCNNNVNNWGNSSTRLSHDGPHLGPPAPPCLSHLREYLEQVFMARKQTDRRSSSQRKAPNRLHQQRQYEQEKRERRRQARQKDLQRLQRWKKHQRVLQAIQLVIMNTNLSSDPLLFLATTASLASQYGESP